MKLVMKARMNARCHLYKAALSMCTGKKGYEYLNETWLFFNITITPYTKSASVGKTASPT